MKAIRAMILTVALAGGALAAMAESTVVTVVKYDNTEKSYKVGETGDLTFEEKALMIKSNAEAEAERVSLTDIKKLLFKTDTKIENSLSNGGLTVYPTIAEGEITVKGIDGEAVVEVYSSMGAKVMDANVSDGESVNVSSLASGVYFVKVGKQITKFSKR